MRTADEVDRVPALAASGLNKSEISRATGVSRAAIRAWLRGEIPGRDGEGTRLRSCLRCHGTQQPFPALTEHAYAYLLGLYLGDGCISADPKGVYRIRIFSIEPIR
jgi:hypothetical protein